VIGGRQAAAGDLDPGRAGRFRRLQAELEAVCNPLVLGEQAGVDDPVTGPGRDPGEQARLGLAEGRPARSPGHYEQAYRDPPRRHRQREE